jgi:isoleucyl-tRNA synthetase
VQPLVGFVDHLTDWYIRRNRTRFWADEASRDRDEAFETLYTVLHTLVRVTAPFVPFISDAIYTELRQKTDPISVHLCKFPEYQSKLSDPDLEKEMKAVQIVVGIGHSLRKEHKLKVRQPLSKAHVICSDEEKLEALKRHENLIAEELNVKQVEFHSDETAFVSLIAKPNFRVLGKKVGKLMNAVQKAVEKLPPKEQKQLLNGKEVSIKVEGETIVLTPEDVSVERQVKDNVIAGTEQDITVALDTVLNAELISEGIARELVNKINTMRREMDFAVIDRIHVKLQTAPEVKQAFEKHRDYICHEVLASDFAFEKCEGDAWDINGYPTMINIQKVIH